MKRIVIDTLAGSITACLAEDNKLLEYETEKRSGRIIVGSVYLGRVENVLPGMQVAFVNIGLEKNGYLFTGESLVSKAQLSEAIDLPTTLNVKEGDEVLVQVVKDSSGTKGVRLTTHISFASRNLVYMPQYDFVLVSRRIEDQELKEKLLATGQEIKPKKGGLIMRTMSNEASYEELIEERDYLIKVNEEIMEKAKSAQAPYMLYEDGNLAKRMLRDVYTPNVDEIIVGDYSLYLDVLDVASKRSGKILDKIKYQDKGGDLFKEYGLSEDVDGMLRKKVNLQSGAYLIIDKTEALTVIDVNTGKYIGEDSLEKTVYETNLMASDEIARQLRLRNIGGIVIIDFIDMEEEEHRQSVLERLKTALKEDRTRTNVVGMTGLGLVELTRKKTRKESISNLVKSCPYCKGEGTIFSNDYIITKIRCSLLDIFAQGYECAVIDLNGDICEYIFKSGSLSRDANKIWAGKRIYLIPHKTYHQEYFSAKGDNRKVLDLPDKARLLY